MGSLAIQDIHTLQDIGDPNLQFIEVEGGQYEVWLTNPETGDPLYHYSGKEIQALAQAWRDSQNKAFSQSTRFFVDDSKNYLKNTYPANHRCYGKPIVAFPTNDQPLCESAKNTSRVLVGEACYPAINIEALPKQKVLNIKTMCQLLNEVPKEFDEIAMIYDPRSKMIFIETSDKTFMAGRINLAGEGPLARLIEKAEKNPTQLVSFTMKTEVFGKARFEEPACLTKDGPHSQDGGGCVDLYLEGDIRISVLFETGQYKFQNQAASFENQQHFWELVNSMGPINKAEPNIHKANPFYESEPAIVRKKSFVVRTGRKIPNGQKAHPESSGHSRNIIFGFIKQAVRGNSSYIAARRFETNKTALASIHHQGSIDSVQALPGRIISRFKISDGIEAIQFESPDTFTRKPTYHDASGHVGNYEFVVRGKGGLNREATRQELERAFDSQVGRTEPFVLGQYHAQVKLTKGDGIAANGEVMQLYHYQDGPTKRDLTIYQPEQPIGGPHILLSVFENVITNLPIHVLKNIRSIRFTNKLRNTNESWVGSAEGVFFDDKVKINGKTFHVKSDGTIYDLTIYLSAPGIQTHGAANTLSHEIGHSLEKMDPSIRNKILLAAKLDGNLLEHTYSLSHWQEHIAEAIREYLMTRPEDYRAKYPHRARVVENLLWGKIKAISPRKQDTRDDLRVAARWPLPFKYPK
ncbi:MAG: hypothetical protein HYU97_08770 [Deltaproteobacteria bacterium]|nr:hypothetical protein [Deltaproteobacteria bacterium]